MHLATFFVLLSCLGFVVGFSPLDLEDLDDTRQTRIQHILPINPYASSVQLTLCSTPEKQEQSRLLITDLMTNEVAAAKIKSFTIEYFRDTYDEGYHQCGELLGPLTELIDRGGDHFKVLNHVKWASTLAIHPPLLTALEYHFPNLELGLDLQWGDPFTLQSTPLLHSLHVSFSPTGLNTVKTSPLLTHVQTQIMNSPNLVELSMEIGSLGCVFFSVDPKFARLKGKRFPPLEKLTLEAFPLTIENVDYWMKSMDWSQMEHLDLRAIYEPTYFFNQSMEIVGGLPRLKTLHMILPGSYETKGLQEFADTFRRFLNVPRDAGLSEIALEGDHRPYLQTILDIHGTALKRLQLHDPERPDEPQREMLSEQELNDIGRRVPKLEEISIDINHTLNGSLPVGFVDTLLSETTFPSLKTIELFGVLGISEWPLEWGWPRVPTDQHPLISKLASRASISRVRIQVGEYRRMGGGYPASWVLWEQRYRELWVAERDASGKMVARFSRG